MHALFYTLAAFALVVLVARDAAWGVLATAAALPMTQSVDTAIPGLNPFNILIFSMVLGLFLRPRLAVARDDRFPAALPALLFCLVVLFGFINAAFIQRVPVVEGFRPFDRADSLEMLKEMWCLVLLMFLTFWAARTLEEVRRYLDLLVAGMSFEVAFCILEYARKLSRITGHVRQANSLGALMSVIALTAAALFMTTHTGKRWLYLGVALGGSFASIQSRSRGGLLALFLGWVALSLLRNRTLSVVLVVLGVTYRMWLPDAVLSRIDHAYTVSDEGDVQAADTAAQRLIIWKAGLNMVRDHPLGIGLGTYSHFSAMYGTATELRHPDKSAHNQFVSVAAEFGYPGFAVFLWLLLRLALAAWRSYRHREEIALTHVGFAGLAALMGISFSSMAGTFFFQATIAGHFWMAMGLLGRAECLSRPGRSAPA
jgi:O-antigen ligase